MNKAAPKINDRTPPYMSMCGRLLPSLEYQYAPTTKGSTPVNRPMIFWLRLMMPAKMVMAQNC
jgi:hypothetical protein